MVPRPAAEPRPDPVGNGTIDPQRLQALLCLAESHLNRHQGDLRTCLDSWNALGLTQDVLTEVNDRD